MRYKLLFNTIIGSVFAMFLVIGSALTVPPDDPGPGRPDEPRLMESLDLTPEQIQLLKNEKTKRRKQMLKLRAELETLRIDLAAESSQDKPDVEKIERLARQMGEVHGQMIAQRVKSIIYLRSILTDKQKKIMDEHQLHFGRIGRKGWDHPPRGRWKK